MKKSVYQLFLEIYFYASKRTFIRPIKCLYVNQSFMRPINSTRDVPSSNWLLQILENLI